MYLYLPLLIITHYSGYIPSSCWLIPCWSFFVTSTNTRRNKERKTITAKLKTQIVSTITLLCSYSMPTVLVAINSRWISQHTLLLCLFWCWLWSVMVVDCEESVQGGVEHLGKKDKLDNFCLMMLYCKITLSDDAVLHWERNYRTYHHLAASWGRGECRDHWHSTLWESHHLTEHGAENGERNINSCHHYRAMKDCIFFCFFAYFVA